ncbi:Ribonuclease P protein component [Candidatus Providencia siddallii]|uniref:Ribonuclease P protein component n=1 Tax=Candidatus Providencia siddallii TaxID=1715285 RepID=A0ABM9NNA9_9GAMM
MNSLIFSKKNRLLTYKSFNNVFKKHQLSNSIEVKIFGCLNGLGYPRIGIIFVKKKIKYAHERNRIKRIIREYFRLHQHELYSMDFIVLIKKNIVNFHKDKITHLLNKIWHCYNHFV